MVNNLKIKGGCCQLPPVKLFLLRACHEGLATTYTLSRRLLGVDLSYHRCGTENEYLTHLFYQCPISRATWFTLRINLRVEEILVSFRDVFIHLTSTLPTDTLVKFCNIMWCIWKGGRDDLGKSGLSASVSDSTNKCII
jgi:zinc-binding in reverse transcriptase